MNLKIKKQEKQPLLSRTEVTAEITFEGKTPSRFEVVQALSKELKSKPELTLVKHIYTEFGATSGDIEAFVYDDKRVMDVLEKKIREVKEPKKQEKQEEQAEDKPEEKKESKDEESKEDPKEEKEPQPDTKEESKDPKESKKEETKEGE